MSRFVVDNPATESPFCEREHVREGEAIAAVRAGHDAYERWRRSSLEERVELLGRVAQLFESRREGIAADIMGQMGKPMGQARGEVGGMLGRLLSLCEQAPAALAPRALRERAGFWRQITREPLGVVIDIAAWNYPLLVPINVVATAVLAGNAVLIKHSPRTPLCAEHFEQIFRDAGAPAGLVQALHVDHPTAAVVIRQPEVAFVSFTGSVRGGREVYGTASRRIVGVGLELGGKDAAYVRADADLTRAVEGTAEGAFYNAGQSCCAVERIYVANDLYADFVDAFVAHTREQWRLGRPVEAATTVGPMALPGAPAMLERQVNEAVEVGGRLLLGGSPARVDGLGRYFEPTSVADCPDDCALMRDESFGPVIGIAPVDDDAEAVGRINASRFGLTASIWSRDAEASKQVGAALEVGTVYLNRCDYLDPELPWTGAKESGLGSSLSHLGFEQLTRPKSWHFRLES